MLIREMAETDLAAVCLIEQETFSDPWIENDFRQSMTDKNNLYLIAEKQGIVIGYCGYWGVVGEGYICNVAVKNEYRRQQIGFLMLNELIAKGYELGIKAFTLEVRCSNTAAIMLYERLGLVSAGVRKDFYTHPKEDAIIMWLHAIQ